MANLYRGKNDFDTELRNFEAERYDEVEHAWEIYRRLGEPRMHPNYPKPDGDPAWENMNSGVPDNPSGVDELGYGPEDIAAERQYLEEYFDELYSPVPDEDYHKNRLYSRGRKNAMHKLHQRRVASEIYHNFRNRVTEDELNRTFCKKRGNRFMNSPSPCVSKSVRILKRYQRLQVLPASYQKQIHKLLADVRDQQKKANTELGETLAFARELRAKKAMAI